YLYAFLYLGLVLTPHTMEADPIIYVADDTRQLGTINLTTGTFTRKGYTPVAMYDIAFAPNGDLYGLNSSSETKLYQIDPDTGTSTLVGNVGAFVYALAFRNDGTLFAAGGSTLYRVNTTTGASTVVGSYGPYVATGDLEFDSGGSLYLTTNGD